MSHFNNNTGGGTSIVRATANDYRLIAAIGRSGVEESHRDSCSVADMEAFLAEHYNHAAIEQELSDNKHLYHIISYNGQPAGFSKIVLNAVHPNIDQQHVTKLDRIYLLKEYYDRKLGYELLKHNIELSKTNGQAGMWLFTWQLNHRAVSFYKRTGFNIIGTHVFKVTETHYNPHFQMYMGF